jgi:hypothetical protein
MAGLRNSVVISNPFLNAYRSPVEVAPGLSETLAERDAGAGRPPSAASIRCRCAIAAALPARRPQEKTHVAPCDLALLCQIFAARSLHRSSHKARNDLTGQAGFRCSQRTGQALRPFRPVARTPPASPGRFGPIRRSCRSRPGVDGVHEVDGVDGGLRSKAKCSASIKETDRVVLVACTRRRTRRQ